MIYRTEHPKPQFMRETWQNLNGPWQFEMDLSCSGKERNLFEAEQNFSQTINVPFCVESDLSGIGYKDFVNSVWYKRDIEITEAQLNGRVFLHFGAVDYIADVYVNGTLVGTHKGGYVSFKFEITEFVKAGKNVITVNATDNTRDRMIPTGKQSGKYASYGCYYTRTTGIWQTVWLEFTPKAYIECVKYTTDVDNATLNITAELCGAGTFTAEATYEGKAVGSASVTTNGGFANVTLQLTEKHVWEVGCGRLYDLKLTYGEDTVASYFGLRSVRLEGNKFLINEKPVFQRLVLDQGFYPDGIYTAPSDAALEKDIDLSMAVGFNGARLHEKVFEERFLYHCDRKGYIVWGEFPNWGLDHSYAESIYGFLPEWMEEVKRDMNHPAIIGWCPFNETWDKTFRKQYDDLLATVYKATKAIDPARPCIDTSGNFHVLTDIYDLHDYEQNPEVFAEHQKPLGDTNVFEYRTAFQNRQQYDGKMPFFISEYGGIRWTNDASGWGYGNGPKTEEEFLARLKGLTDVLLDNPLMFGLCYTQLTDVEQEQNGIYTYTREEKFPAEVIKAIFAREAAYEKQ